MLVRPLSAECDPADDPALRDFIGLTDVEMRSVREPAEGLFLAEGAKVIRRALAAGLTPRRVLTEPKWLPELRPELEQHPVEVLLAGPESLARITGYRVHRGALASFQRPVLREPAQVLAGSRLIAVLVDLVDHTNVGSVFRTAAALGVDAVLLTERCADPLYRRAVKVSMGAVFSVPWTRSGADPLPVLRAAGLRVLALTPGGQVDLRDIGPSEQGTALLLGTEGPGLAAEVLRNADQTVRIGMHNRVDSLNVAAASAIALYQLS
ncbi:MAG: TrmH family RNA methyltransferase [Candidatus Nanopelagicales bacterium]